MRAAGLVTSLAPMTERDVGLRQIAVDVVHFDQLVVGNVGFGEQHVHVAGHASGDGMDAEVDVDAALGEGVVEFADFVLRLRDGHAVAGNDDHFAGGGENAGGFFGAWRCGRSLSSVAAAAEVCIWPNAPNSTLVNERFMALHMMTERMKPEEPSSAPAMISSLLFEHEAHERGGKAGVGVQERDDGGHVGAADGSDQQHAEDQRTRRSWRERDRAGRDARPARRPAAIAAASTDEVDEVLSFIDDGALRQDFLQLAGGHQAAGEGERADDYFECRSRPCRSGVTCGVPT